MQASHDLVPPEALQPVLRQLVDNFVHDRARPEVMTLGLLSVRELCTRTPLIMTPELLQVSILLSMQASLFQQVDTGLLKSMRNKCERVARSSPSTGHSMQFGCFSFVVCIAPLLPF